MDTIKITLPDESVKEYPINTNYYEITKDYASKHKIDVLAVRINNEVFSLDHKATKDEKLELVDVTDLAGYKMYQAGLKFLFMVAVKELYENAKVSFLHSVPRGILSEIEMSQNLTHDDIRRIKAKMASIIGQKERIIRYNVDVKDAYKYFMNHDEVEKAKNIQVLPNEVITLYKLRNHLNYFYSNMPYDTSVLNRFELVFIGRNRIVLVCPNVVSGRRVPEYVHYENIVVNFMESKKWLKTMNTPYLADLNLLVTKSKIKEFIESNELAYTEDLMASRDDILTKRDVRVVLIAGPSSSGKTTTMKRLSSLFISKGYETVTISTDDFFVNRTDTPKNDKGEYDYECLRAINLELFNSTIKDLLDGKEVELPEYDFVSGKSIKKGKKIKLKENSFLFIEGLHCLNDELTPFIDDKYKYKIYLSPFMPMSIDRHNYISTLDLRLIRRMVRDNRERGKRVDSTIKEWQVVRNGEEKYIFPYVYQADRIINTALSYELGVLKTYANPLLYSVGIDSPYYNEARRLIHSLQPYFDIPSEYVPNNSILREFVG